MKRCKRPALMVIAVTALYLAAYCLMLDREPDPSRAGAGPLPLEARYTSKRIPTPMLDDTERAVQTLFSPLEWLDRTILPDRWEAPRPSPPSPPVPIEMTAT